MNVIDGRTLHMTQATLMHSIARQKLVSGWETYFRNQKYSSAVTVTDTETETEVFSRNRKKTDT